MRPLLLLAAVATLKAAGAAAQDATHYTHADTLRGSNGPGRSWWDATFYDLHTRVNPADSSISGWNGITYRVLQPAREMQIDLQVPLEVDSMMQDHRRLTWRRDSNAFFVTLQVRPDWLLTEVEMRSLNCLPAGNASGVDRSPSESATNVITLGCTSFCAPVKSVCVPGKPVACGTTATTWPDVASNLTHCCSGKVGGGPGMTVPA